MRHSTRNMSRQRGAVLLVLALIIIMGSTYTLLAKLNSDTNFYIRQSKETQKSLRLAKQALMAYAINFRKLMRQAGTI